MIGEPYSNHAPEEIAALAEHQKEILKRRFPNYEHALAACNDGPYCWLDVCDGTITILVATFFSDRIRISSRFEEDGWCGAILYVDYADPRFTDDTISDIVEEYKQAEVIL